MIMIRGHVARRGPQSWRHWIYWLCSSSQACPAWEHRSGLSSHHHPFWFQSRWRDGDARDRSLAGIFNGIAENDSCVGSTSRSPVLVSLHSLPLQLKPRWLARFESPVTSVPHTLLFGFNLGDTTGAQLIGVWPVEVCSLHRHSLDLLRPLRCSIYCWTLASRSFVRDFFWQGSQNVSS